MKHLVVTSKARWPSSTVSSIRPAAPSASGTFGVQPDLRNPQGEIPAGVKCLVQVGR